MNVDLIGQYNLNKNRNYSYYYANISRQIPAQNQPIKPQINDQFQQVQASTSIAQPLVKGTNNLLIGLGMLVSAATALLITKKPKVINKGLDDAKKFIEDIPYKKSILEGLGLNQECYEKLNSIVGKHEFLSIIDEIKDNPKAFSVGGEFFENVRNKIFNVNLHIHTTNSDGQMSIEKLLDQASKYADKFAEKNNNKPFIIGITDHDTVAGAIEAVKLIFKNPDKYKNLKVILGTETKSLYSSKYLNKPLEVDLLSYCINPFNKEIKNLNKEQLETLQRGLKSAIKNANNMYKGIQSKYNFSYNFDDMAKIRHSIRISPCDVKLSTKDYMQFRLIYADTVENNQMLIKYLKENGVNLGDLDFSIPKYNINKETQVSPYWLNYVNETKKYIISAVKEKNPTADLSQLEKCFKDVNNDTRNALTSIEDNVLNPKSNMHPPALKAIDFNKVLATYSKLDESISGIAHPCKTYCQEKDNPNVKLLIEEIFSSFKSKIGQKDSIYEGYYQSYWPMTQQSWKDFAIELGTKYGFIKTGGLDSHYNNLFTAQDNLSHEKILELIN